MNRSAHRTNIPFRRAAIGMRVMGVLETRNLDFRNLIMLSLNEGLVFPRRAAIRLSSPNLRGRSGMTTIEHKNSVYAIYYFYRLIQRAENITLLYNTASDGLNRGEMSRFMLQFPFVESPHDISRQYLEAGQSPNKASRLKYTRRTRYCNGCTTHTTSAGIPTHSFRLRHSTPTSTAGSILLPLRCRTESSRRGKRRDRLRPLFGTIFHRSAELVYRTSQPTERRYAGKTWSSCSQRRKVAGIRRHLLSRRSFSMCLPVSNPNTTAHSLSTQSNRILSAAIAPQRPAVRPFPYGRHGTKVTETWR